MKHENPTSDPKMLEISQSALRLSQEEWDLLESLAISQEISPEELISRTLKDFLSTPPPTTRVDSPSEDSAEVIADK